MRGNAMARKQLIIYFIYYFHASKLPLFCPKDSGACHFLLQLGRLIGRLLSRLKYRSAQSGSFAPALFAFRSEEHTSELQSRENLVCRLLLEKKKKNLYQILNNMYIQI